jgi:hypothetical protein
MNRRKRLKGSFTLEYAVTILVVAIALAAVANYVRNAICGNMRSSADVFGGGRQYQP